MGCTSVHRRIERGAIGSGETVLFWYTGGNRNVVDTGLTNLGVMGVRSLTDRPADTGHSLCGDTWPVFRISQIE